MVEFCMAIVEFCKAMVKPVFFLIITIFIVWFLANIDNDKHNDDHNTTTETTIEEENDSSDESVACENRCLKGCAKEVKAILNDCESQILVMEMNKTNGATIASFRNQCFQHVSNEVHPACARKCRADCR